MIRRKKTTSKFFKLKDFDLGWFVGIIEGEGSTSARLNKTTGYLTVELTVSSTDEDIINKLHSIYPGKSKYIKEYLNNYKTQYIWAVTDRQGIRTVISKILPYMGERRTLKMREVIDKINEYENS